MSRGLGSLQRRILAELEHGHASAQQLVVKCCRPEGAMSKTTLNVAEVVNCPPSDNAYSALRSIQRALRSLHHRGAVVRLPGRFLAVISNRGAAGCDWGARLHYCLPEHADRIMRAHGHQRLCEADCVQRECHLDRGAMRT